MYIYVLYACDNNYFYINSASLCANSSHTIFFYSYFKRKKNTHKYIASAFGLQEFMLKWRLINTSNCDGCEEIYENKKNI